MQLWQQLKATISVQGVHARNALYDQIIRESEDELLEIKMMSQGTVKPPPQRAVRKEGKFYIQQFPEIEQFQLQAADVEWDLVSVRDANPVGALVRSGLLTFEECEQYYHIFKSRMALALPFTTSDIPFRELCVSRPCLAMAGVVTARVNTTKDRAEMYTSFMDRVILERVAMRNKFDLDLIQALTIHIMAIYPGFEPRFSIFMLLNIALANSLDLGREQDRAVLRDSEHYSEKETQEALNRMRMYMCIALNATAFTQTSRIQVASLFVEFDTNADALLASPISHVIDTLIVSMVRILRVSRLGLDQLTENYLGKGCTSDVVKTTSNRWVSKIDAVLMSCNSAIEGVPQDLIWIGNLSMRTTYWMLKINLLENALNMIVFKSCDFKKKDAIPLFAEIEETAQQLIDTFLSLADQVGPYITKYYYFRPLYALSALLRVRFIAWSLQIPFSVDVEALYDRVESVWSKLAEQSITAAGMKPLLGKVCQYVKIGFRQNEMGETLLTPKLLQSLMARVLPAGFDERAIEEISPLSEEEGSFGSGSSSNGMEGFAMADVTLLDYKDVLEAPGPEGIGLTSAVDIEAVLRDLFSEMR
ncbi:hypothetical protein TRVA0_007S03928 [Trichomonascus vanleenenianus]|uniref:uncharacterized protein n=1 Tax=Trichomonascus vanleenenianus TaxID=2268995 RepID=UPI003ECA6843